MKKVLSPAEVRPADANHTMRADVSCSFTGVTVVQKTNYFKGFKSLPPPNLCDFIKPKNLGQW